MKKSRMRLLGIATAMSLLAPVAPAQQPQQCVNPANLDALVFWGRSDLKVVATRGPAFMGSFRPPAGFSLIGSGAINGIATKVAYKSSLAGDKAHAALLGALRAAGWADETPPGSTGTFVVKGAMNSATVCRNGERSMLMTVEAAGTTYLTVTNLSPQRRRECNAPDPAMQMPFPMDRNSMPRFQFPAGTTLGLGSGSGSGGNDLYTTSSRVISTETTSGLLEYLGVQIGEQGWQRNAGWSGTRSAGSTWSRTSDGVHKRGTLEIIRVSEGTYDVDFTVTQ